MCLWVAWTKRNNIVWNNGVFNPSHMVTGALRHLEEYQRCHPCPVKNSRRPLTRWECPPSGRLKINADGAYRADVNQGGLGVGVNSVPSVRIFGTN